MPRNEKRKIAAARAELVKNAPPLDFCMPLDSLDVMEHAMRHFYFRAKIEERTGDRPDWRRVDDAFWRGRADLRGSHLRRQVQRRSAADQWLAGDGTDSAVGCSIAPARNGPDNLNTPDCRRREVRAQLGAPTWFTCAIDA